MTVSLVGFRPELANIIQQNALVRTFYEALYPRLLFRADVESFRMEPNMTPLTPGQDPTVRTYGTEQWRVEAVQRGDGMQTYMPQSRVQIASKFSQDTQKLGELAGDTMNRVTRNELFTAYLSGDTMSMVLASSGTAAIRVASINGFRQRVLLGQLVPVSPAAPIAVELGNTNIAANVVAATPDNTDFPNGPGTLTLSANLGANLAARSRVRALQRARILRAGNVATVDALSGTSLLTLNDITQAVALLRSQNVPPHADGMYHVHIPQAGEAQLMQDNAWQRIYQSIPDAMPYRSMAIGANFACYFYSNTECPNQFNVGTLFAEPSGSARAAPYIGAEVINDGGTPIGRTIITGGGSIYEHYIPESDYITEAGIMGKVGNFQVTNNGVTVLTDRIRYTIRAPLDVLQQIVDHAWSWSGGFAVPTDLLSGNGAMFKRALVIEHAG
jgi:hypothetical protein